MARLRKNVMISHLQRGRISSNVPSSQTPANSLQARHSKSLPPDTHSHSQTPPTDKGNDESASEKLGDALHQLSQLEPNRASQQLDHLRKLYFENCHPTDGKCVALDALMQRDHKLCDDVDYVIREHFRAATNRRRITEHWGSLWRSSWGLHLPWLFCLFGSECVSKRFLLDLCAMQKVEPKWDVAFRALCAVRDYRQSPDTRTPGVSKVAEWKPWDAQHAVDVCKGRPLEEVLAQKTRRQSRKSEKLSSASTIPQDEITIQHARAQAGTGQVSKHSRPSELKTCLDTPEVKDGATPDEPYNDTFHDCIDDGREHEDTESHVEQDLPEVNGTETYGFHDDENEADFDSEGHYTDVHETQGSHVDESDEEVSNIRQRRTNDINETDHGPVFDYDECEENETEFSIEYGRAQAESNSPADAHDSSLFLSSSAAGCGGADDDDTDDDEDDNDTNLVFRYRYRSGISAPELAAPCLPIISSVQPQLDPDVTFHYDADTTVPASSPSLRTTPKAPMDAESSKRATKRRRVRESPPPIPAPPPNALALLLSYLRPKHAFSTGLHCDATLHSLPELESAHMAILHDGTDDSRPTRCHLAFSLATPNTTDAPTTDTWVLVSAAQKEDDQAATIVMDMYTPRTTVREAQASVTKSGGDELFTRATRILDHLALRLQWPLSPVASTDIELRKHTGGDAWPLQALVAAQLLYQLIDPAQRPLPDKPDPCLWTTLLHVASGTSICSTGLDLSASANQARDQVPAPLGATTADVCRWEQEVIHALNSNVAHAKAALEEHTLIRELMTRTLDALQCSVTGRNKKAWPQMPQVIAQDATNLIRHLQAVITERKAQLSRDADDKDASMIEDPLLAQLKRQLEEQKQAFTSATARIVVKQLRDSTAARICDITDAMASLQAARDAEIDALVAEHQAHINRLVECKHKLKPDA